MTAQSTLVERALLAARTAVQVRLAAIEESQRRQEMKARNFFENNLKCDPSTQFEFKWLSPMKAIITVEDLTFLQTFESFETMYFLTHQCPDCLMYVREAEIHNLEALGSALETRARLGQAFEHNCPANPHRERGKSNAERVLELLTELIERANTN